MFNNYSKYKNVDFLHMRFFETCAAMQPVFYATSVYMFWYDE